MQNNPQGIFESPAAAAGQNGRSLNIPAARSDAVLWLVQRISKLTNERLNTADIMRDARKAAVNDGYSVECLNAALRLGKMSPEARDKYRERMTKALSLYGLTIETIYEDPAPDKLLAGHLAKLKTLSSERSALTAEISETYKAAKEHGIDIHALKQIIKLARMDEEDRSEWFARLDNLGTILNYW